MSREIIDGRPKLPAPPERPALPPADDDRDRSTDGSAMPWWQQRRVWLAAGLVAAILLLIAFCSPSGGDDAQGEGEGEGSGPPVVSVTAARARATRWERELTAIGTLDAVQGVQVTTELAGIVSAILFRNGERAEAGETLVRLDTTTERAERAALAAERDRARLAYDRALRLVERGAVAEAEVEQARATWQTLVAQVRQVETAIEKKRIDAPFAGTLGIRQISLGEFVAAGTPVVTLQQIAPIFVNFELPERTFPLLREGLEISVRSDAFGDRTFSGKVNAINPEVRAETRSYTVQATIANTDRMLKPGMFADVTVHLPGDRQVVTVPTTALTRNAYGDALFVVGKPDPEEQRKRREQQEKEDGQGLFARLFGGGEKEKGKGAAPRSGGESENGARGSQAPDLVAKSVFIEVGEQRGLFTEILNGIEAGMPVVTAGQLKLDDGAPIRIVDRDALEGAEPVPDQP